MDVGALGPNRFHGLDRALQHARKRPPPPGMGRANDLCQRIGKKHRLAIGGQYRKRDTGLCRHQSVGLLPGGERAIDSDDVRGVDLMHAQQGRGLSLIHI